MPSVIDPDIRIIFCEGRPGSLDDLLLGNLIRPGPVIVPVGGKRGMRAFIEGYLARPEADQQPAYIGFRDRDFDVNPPDTPQLIPRWGGKSIWLTYRASIENYFIDAELIHQYWQESQKGPRWGHGPAPAKDEIESHIRISAQELADYQAVRWGLAHLKPGPRWPEIPTAWTKEGSGHIPPSLAYDDCLSQARQLVGKFQEKSHKITSSLLEQQAKAYRDRFQDEQFFQEQGYLAWFHGKDHLAQLSRRLAPNFPRRHYATWAAEHLTIEKHPDLQELVKRAIGAEL